MEFVQHDHRHALALFQAERTYAALYQEVIDTVRGIDDEALIAAYESLERENKKSLSQPINRLLKERLTALGWQAESAIFSDPRYADGQDKNRWRLDFAKGEIAVEVAFNHGEAVAWNLIKPVLASELNHVSKQIQTSAGIVICATEEMKRVGNFDRSVGSYEKFLRYLTPMGSILVTPLLIVGLEPPASFHIDPATKTAVRS